MINPNADLIARQRLVRHRFHVGDVVRYVGDYPDYLGKTYVVMTVLRDLPRSADYILTEDGWTTSIAHGFDDADLEIANPSEVWLTEPNAEGYWWYRTSPTDDDPIVIQTEERNNRFIWRDFGAASWHGVLPEGQYQLVRRPR